MKPSLVDSEGGQTSIYMKSDNSANAAVPENAPIARIVHVVYISYWFFVCYTDKVIAPASGGADSWFLQEKR